MYWADQNIVELDDMLEHLRNHVKAHFYDIVRNPIIQTHKRALQLGWHRPFQVYLNDGYVIQEPGFILYFEKEKLITWNGKYVPTDMGVAFTL